MDDTEAKFLIDQFNKYASWKLSRWSYVLPSMAVLVATVAITYSLSGVYQKVISLPYPYDNAVWTIAIGFLGAMIVLATNPIVDVHRDILSFEERLVTLEDYRFKHKSLPDELTFRKITNRKFKSEDLEKLLKENETSSTEPRDPADSTEPPNQPENPCVRTSLLDYYSSQTQSHAIQLLTAVLIGVGLLQVHPSLSLLIPMWMETLLISGGMSVLLALGSRGFLRMLYWGYMSSAILRVPKKAGEVALSGQTPDKWNDLDLETNVLHHAAGSSAEDRHKSIFKYADTKPILKFWGSLVLAIWALIVLVIVFWNYV